MPEKAIEHKDKVEWFRSWFDTKYYHSLYRHRDEEEAKAFIMHLLEQLEVPEESRILDLACGKGRHAITMHELGMIVTGLDLSANSIAQASLSQTDQLDFYTWDMREPYQAATFDYIMNLFTSFGYFDDLSDNQKVLDAVSYGLKPGAYFVMDYLNAGVIDPKQSAAPIYKNIDGYEFYTQKTIDQSKVVKTIKVVDGDETHHYQERVQLFKLHDLEPMFEKSSLKIEAIYGSYQLTDYVEDQSPRLIIVARKS